MRTKSCITSLTDYLDQHEEEPQTVRSIQNASHTSKDEYTLKNINTLLCIIQTLGVTTKQMNDNIIIKNTKFQW